LKPYSSTWHKQVTPIFSDCHSLACLFFSQSTRRIILLNRVDTVERRYAYRGNDSEQGTEVQTALLSSLKIHRSTCPLLQLLLLLLLLYFRFRFNWLFREITLGYAGSLPSLPGLPKNLWELFLKDFHMLGARAATTAPQTPQCGGRKVKRSLYWNIQMTKKTIRSTTTTTTNTTLQKTSQGRGPYSVFCKRGRGRIWSYATARCPFCHPSQFVEETKYTEWWAQTWCKADAAYLILLVDLMRKSLRDHDTTALDERLSASRSTSSGQVTRSSARAETT